MNKEKSKSCETESNDFVVKERLEPDTSQPDYLTLDKIASCLRELSEAIPENGEYRVLDIGCGLKPYFPFFKGKISEYIGIDSDISLNADIKADLDEPLLLQEENVDIIICTQVLEHVKRPKFLVDEMFRVCKKGGIVFLSAPFVWEVHNYPQDYWRFTEQGLKLLFEKFSEIKIIPCGNTAQGIAQTISLLINRSSKYSRINRLIFKFFNKYLMRVLSKCKDDLLPVNFVLKAVK